MTLNGGSRTHQGRTGSTDHGKLARLLASVVGVSFLLVGILGFVPGITTNYDTLMFAGHESEAKLLGVFQVSVLHNVVHLLFGIVGLAMARKATTALSYLIGGGVVYLVLWIYGLVVDHGSEANFVPLNDADNWLHLILGLAMIAAGVVARRTMQHHTGARSTV